MDFQEIVKTDNVKLQATANTTLKANTMTFIQTQSDKQECMMVNGALMKPHNGKLDLPVSNWSTEEKLKAKGTCVARGGVVTIIEKVPLVSTRVTKRDITREDIRINDDTSIEDTQKLLDL